MAGFWGFGGVPAGVLDYPTGVRGWDGGMVCFFGRGEADGSGRRRLRGGVRGGLGRRSGRERPGEVLVGAG